MLMPELPLRRITMAKIERLVDGFWGIPGILQEIREEIEKVIDSGESADVDVEITARKT